MRRFRALLTIGSFALLSSAALIVSSAAAQDLRVYEPSCKLVLRSSPQAFSDLYIKQTNNSSEAGLDDAALYWADCKGAANLAQLSQSPALRARLLNLYRLEDRFFSAETIIAYLAAGGGTMYPHGYARFQPARQLHFQKLIALTLVRAGAAQSGAISVRYSAAKSKLEARLKRVQIPKPFVETFTKAEADAKRRDWLAEAKKYSVAYRDIRKTIGSRVDATSVLVLEFLATGVWAEEL